MPYGVVSLRLTVSTRTYADCPIDLATFINYRLERPFDQLPVHPSSGIPCKTIGIMSQSIVYNIGGTEREFDQPLLAPIL